MLRGRAFGGQVQTFSCPSVLHNAVFAWNIFKIKDIVNQLRSEGKKTDEGTLKPKRDEIDRIFAESNLIEVAKQRVWRIR